MQENNNNQPLVESASGFSVTDDRQDDGAIERGGKAGKKISPFLILLVLVIIAGFGSIIFFGGTKLKAFLNGEGRKKDSAEGVLTFKDAPSEIGKNAPFPELPEPPPTSVETKEEVVEDKKEVQVVQVQQQQPQQPQVDEVAQRRLASPISTNGSKDKKASARVALINQTSTLIKGTRIPCVLENAIKSELDGFTSCIVKDDIYSGNAKTLLIEKGSRVTGYYSGDVKNGTSRLQIVWDRIITPYDVAIQLNSPTTDRLGASGAVGEVDNRWGLRIGSALLVSLIGDTMELLVDNKEDSGSNNVYVDGQTRDTVEDLATQILEKNIDLPPIISIKNGETILIYAVEDIDFSGVYKTVKALN